MKISSKEVGAGFDRVKERKAFDDTKAGVKGLVDSGIVNIPKIFIRSIEGLDSRSPTSELQVPVIDLSDLSDDRRRKEIVDQVRRASADLGLFQLVNHGIPSGLLESTIDGIHMFHEQDAEEKIKLYTSDVTERVRYGSCNVYHYGPVRPSDWRDTLHLDMFAPDQLHPDQVPTVCRDIAFKYANQVSKVGETVFELLSEALGLKQDHLISMECSRGRRNINFHYYPTCPQPELTMGASSHRDPSFLTIILQDHIGGYQC